MHAYRAPSEIGRAFRRSNVAILGVGSVGLRIGATEQPAMPTAQLLSIQAVPWGWRVSSQRLKINTWPRLKVVPAETINVNLPRGDDLEPLVGFSRTLRDISDLLLPKPGEEDPWPYKSDSEDPKKFILWKAEKRNLAVRWANRKMDRRPDDLPPSSSDLLKDLQVLLLHGIREWIDGRNIYGDGQMLTLRELHEDKGRPYVTFEVSRFSKTRVVNWLLPRNIFNGGKNSFRTNHLLKELPNSKFLQRHRYLSWRTEVSVLLTVKRKAGHDLILKIRTKDVGVSPRKVTLFATGGCRPVGNYPDGSIIRQAGWTIEESATNELERETGFKVEKSNKDTFQLIGLYLDPLFLTPVFLYWLNLDEKDYLSYWRTHWKGEDRWESEELFAVQIRDEDSWNDILGRILKRAKAILRKRRILQEPKISADPAMGIYMWLDSPIWRQ